MRSTGGSFFILICLSSLWVSACNPLVTGSTSPDFNPGVNVSSTPSPAPNQIQLPAFSLFQGDCFGPVSVTLQNANGTPILNAGSPIVVSLNAGGSANFYSGTDATCSNGSISQTSIAAGSSFGTFYIKDSVAENISLTADASSSQLGIVTHALAVTVSDTAPNSVSSLSLWLKADSISQSNGASIATWSDSSTSGYDHTQSNAGLRPTLVTQALNGFPAVQFDGVSQYLQNTAINLAGLPAASMHLVYRWRSLASGPLVVWGWETPNSSLGFGFKMQNGGNGFGYTATATAMGTETNLYGVNADMLWHQHTITYTSGSFNAFMDGPLAPTLSTAAQTGNFETTVGGLIMGCFYLFGNYGLCSPVQISEAIIFTQSESSTDRQTVECYLANKYALSISENCATAYPAPATPTSANAVSTVATQISVSWAPSATQNISGYKVERSLDGVTNWTQIAATPRNSLQFTDSGLTTGTAYFYRVRAYSAGGNSVYGPIVSTLSQ